jgi:putative membrane protein
MVTHAIAAWLHYLGMMAMMALLAMEHLLFNEKLDLARSRLLLRIDALYGTLAGIQIGTGIWRMWLEKGSAYYLSNPLFHAKIGLFALVGLLSLYPTLTFLAWRTGLRQQQAPQIAPGKARLVTMIIRLELLGLLLIPLLATLIADGVAR